MNNLTPSQDQVMGQLRIIITSLGSIATVLGITGAATINQDVNIALALLGPATLLGGAAWSLIANSRASIMKAAAKPVDSNTPAPEIVLPLQEKALADSLPSNVTAAHIAKVLLFAFALGFLALPHDASAQTGNILKDIATARAKTAAPKAAVAPSTAAAPKTQTVANPLAVIQAFTEADLTAALADATANKDTAAINCYTALLPIVQSGVANPLPTTLGGFELLQKARDLQSMLASLQSPNGPLSQLNIACAPLVLSVQNTLVLLGVVGGGVALTGGAGGLALPGLGALIPAL
jgi:hypothetical protein